MSIPVFFLFFVACEGSNGTIPGDNVRAIVDPNRTTHFFDQPFPNDSMLDGDMHTDLTDFPETPSEITREVISGWARRVSKTSQGFANHGAAYFRFEGPLDIPTALAGLPTDPVLLIDIETGEQIPLATRFTTSALGDPFVADNLLALAPALGHPPPSGATLAAIVMESAGAHAAENWEASPEVKQALTRADITGRPAVATTFTIQDTTGELIDLFAGRTRKKPASRRILERYLENTTSSQEPVHPTLTLSSPKIAESLGLSSNLRSHRSRFAGL